MKERKPVHNGDNIGKLKRRLSKKCPECGSLLEERNYRQGIYYNYDMIICPNCGYEDESKSNKHKHSSTREDKYATDN